MQKYRNGVYVWESLLVCPVTEPMYFEKGSRELQRSKAGNAIFLWEQIGMISTPVKILRRRYGISRDSFRQDPAVRTGRSNSDYGKGIDVCGTADGRTVGNSDISRL